MSVTSCTLTGQDGGQQLDYVWNHTRHFLVHTSADTNDDYAVITGGRSASPDPLPEIYAEHPTNSLANCKSVVARRRGDSRTVWDVVAQYDSTVGDGGDTGGNPELIPPELQWSTVHRDRVVEKDIFGNPVVNKANDQFDEPVIADDNTLQLNVTVHRFLFDGGAINSFFMNRVNQNTFYGGAPATVKLSAVQAVPTLQGTTLVWKVTYEFHYRPETWVKQILNRGLRHKVAGAGEPVANDPLVVKNLKANGDLLPDGTPIEPPLLFLVYKEADFTTLGIGS